MADTQTYVQKVSDQVLDTVRTAQAATLNTLGFWAQATQAVSSQLAPQASKWAEKVPQPSVLVDEVFDVVEKVVANQREFSHKLISATTPAVSSVAEAGPAAAKKK